MICSILTTKVDVEIPVSVNLRVVNTTTLEDDAEFQWQVCTSPNYPELLQGSVP